MNAAGIDWVRIEIGWPEVEPVAPNGGTHSYSWSVSDRLLEAIATRRMELVAMPMATPAWARTARGEASACGRRSEVATERASDYGAFVAAIVDRYGPNGTFWASRPDLDPAPIRRYELWNEPNWNGFWCPEPDPEAYALVAEAGARQIRLHDPGASVIVGGLAALQDSKHEGGVLRGMAVDDFLDRAVARVPELPDLVDSIGFHPYDLDPAMNLSLIGWLRTKLEQSGFDEAKIALTEFGWRGGVGLGALTEASRAANYTAMTGMLTRTDCGVSALAAHTWQSPELDLNNSEHWWGIASPLTGLLHPSGNAYREQVALYEGRGLTPAPRDLIRVCGGDEPDQDGDGTPDPYDDYPIDPDQSDGSGEEAPPAPEVRPEIPRERPARVEDEFFGATIVTLPEFTKLGREFRAMAAAGILQARLRVNWSHIEPVGPADPSYDRLSRWGWMDRIILNLGLNGIGFSPSFGSIPAWVSPTGGDFDAEYAAFMRRFAERYGRGGSFWSENRHLDAAELAVRDYEVWQFGNQPAHAPDGDAGAADYAATYETVRTSIRSWDPGARILASLGELGEGGRAGGYLTRMVASKPGLRGGIDGVQVWAEHARTGGALESVMADVREGLDDSGNPDAPMLLSFGAPIAGPQAIPKPERVRLFEEGVASAVRGDCGVGGIFAHAWTTPESDPNNSYEWFGIADRETLELTPSGLAFRDLAAAFTGQGSVAPETTALHPCNGLPTDRDGDGTPDAADPDPLDPDVSAPIALPPARPAIVPGFQSPTSSRSAEFALSASGAVSFQCKLDSARWHPCGADPRFEALAHGTHELRARAVSDLGLVGEPATVSWEVDIEGPEIASVTGPTPISLDSRVVFEFATGQPAAATYCQIDGYPWTACSSPRVYGFVGDGLHDFRLKAVDELGNVGPVRLTVFEVRTQPGPARIEAGPAQGGFSGPLPRFAFAADFAARYQCRFDAGPWGDCEVLGEHQPAEDLVAGPHLFEVRGIGGTGKLGDSARRGFEVDTSPPELRIGVAKIGRRSVRFKLDTVDAAGVDAMYCRVDRRRETQCRPNFRAKGLKRGKHKLRVRAIDTVGNVQTQQLRFRIPKS
jgi:hypothetical protein